MEIRSILVNVGIYDGSRVLSYAIGLAKAFDAELIGVAATEPNLVAAGADGAQLAAEYYVAARGEIEKQLAAAEQRFRAATADLPETKWRAFVANTTRTIADEARRCDIVVTAAGDNSGLGDDIDSGHLILSCGRPVIVIADGSAPFSLENAVVAWKDTREARRALADALPLLRLAKQVKVITVSEGETAFEEASLADAVKWLARHGVEARSELVPRGEDLVDRLGGAARPDLVVSGGYGHTRFREWLFGGVTRSLLDARNVNRLFSN